jgi:ABC-type nitrate/sulfonate/bicarbonate transport system substrate-binding protein
MDRRTFLKRLGATGAGLALGGPALAPWARADNPPLGRMTYQLAWIKNFQFAGEYIADYRHYFQNFGVDVELLSGGPTVFVEAKIMSGGALVGQSMPDLFVNANVKGGTLKCIAAAYEDNVASIISLAKSALKTPEEMKGRRIGIQITNTVIWHSFLKKNKIDPSELTTVPVQFDFTPLVSGEVDGFFGFIIDDAVQLVNSGVAIHILRLSDFNYNTVSATYEVRADSLTDKAKRAQLVAFMKGSILGWRDVIKEPAFAADLTVNVYGKGNGLDLRGQAASIAVSNELMVNATTRKHGLFWMSPEAVDYTITSLAAGGVRATPDMFTNEILEEAYAGLKAV